MTILENYLKSIRVQKVLNTEPGEEGFSLVELVVVIAVLAILSAVAIPAFIGVQANARASAVKNGLANGVKECVIRAADNQTTTFATAQSFPGNYNGYTVGQVGGANTCYSALATNTANPAAESNFQIQLDPATGNVIKTCTRANAPGCSANNDW
tara:strand:+ start:736 stop:1200 length:465 start_codon:yes stop_codon:yes gene_type:complete